MSLTQVIKEKAYQLGFTLVGVTTSEPLPHADVFAAWLEQGRQGEMNYLNTSRSRSCRAQPARILSECRSVLVLGMRYPAPLPLNTSPSSAQRLHGKIAAYAWGEDYHHILPKRLQTLVDFLELQVGQPIANRWYTDTGPVLERELAQRAGLGWIGKNTCLINPTGGSYYLLAEILLEVELEPDQPFIPDRCGSCRRCITACPTGCILPDRTLDARRCISYLTIELKGSIPLEIRSLMDGWVFGCDVCQQVCPWNHFASSEVDPAFSPFLTRPDPDLLEEINLHAGDFNQKYRRSPLKRARRRGYLRNITIALGNQQDPKAVPLLSRVLMSDPDPLVRSHAAWALGEISSRNARQALDKAAGFEDNPGVILEIKAALSH